MATCLLLVSLEEALVKAASLRLLIPAGLGAMGQNFVSREEARSATYTSLCGQAVWADPRPAGLGVGLIWAWCKGVELFGG